jgi:hypothetical protein
MADVICTPVCDPNSPVDLPSNNAPSSPQALQPSTAAGQNCTNPLFVKLCGDREFDTNTLCDPATGLPVLVITAYSDTGVPTSTAYNADGTLHTANAISALVACGSSSESDPIEMCDGGTTPFIRWVVKKNGAPTGVSFDTNLSGAPYVIAGAVSKGACGTVNVVAPVDHCLFDSDGVKVADVTVDYGQTPPVIWLAGTKTVVAIPLGGRVGSCADYQELDANVGVSSYAININAAVNTGAGLLGALPAASAYNTVTAYNRSSFNPLKVTISFAPSQTTISGDTSFLVPPGATYSVTFDADIIIGFSVLHVSTPTTTAGIVDVDSLAASVVVGMHQSILTFANS